MFIHKTNTNSYFSYKNTKQLSFQKWYTTYNVELDNMFNIMIDNIKKDFPSFKPTNDHFIDFVNLIYIKSSKN